MFYLGRSWLGRGSGGSYELIYKKSSSNLFTVDCGQVLKEFSLHALGAENVFPSLDYSSLEHFILQKFESEKITSSDMPKTICLGCSNAKKSRKQENLSLFTNSILQNGKMREENQAKLV